MRALITGAAGFVGQYLCQALLERGWAVTGATLGPPAHPILSDSEHSAVQWVTADVRQQEDVKRAVGAAMPDAVFHLAGVTFIPGAAADPGAACEANVVAATRLVADIRRRRAAGEIDPVVIVVGSAEQYGRHDAAAMPLTESHEQRPLTVYAATKVAQEAMVLEAFRSEGVRVICARSFNHSGAGQAPQLLLPALVRRAVAAKASGATTFPVGNTSPVRDFLHVRDVVAAYLLLAERGKAGEAYNVSSGTGRTVASVIDYILARVGVQAAAVPDPALVRPADVPHLIGDSSKLRATTGWAPQFTFDDIISDHLRAATH